MSKKGWHKHKDVTCCECGVRFTSDVTCITQRVKRRDCRVPQVARCRPCGIKRLEAALGGVSSQDTA